MLNGNTHISRPTTEDRGLPRSRRRLTDQRSAVRDSCAGLWIAEFRIRAGGFGACATEGEAAWSVADGRCQSGLSQRPISLSNQQMRDCPAAWNRPDIGSAAAGRKEILIETGLRRLTERTQLTHRTVATTRLRLVYLAAKITRHGGQTEIHFGSQYQERDRFDQLMARLRSIERKMDGFIPVVNTPLRA